MNKNTRNFLLIVVALVIVGGIVWYGRGSSLSDDNLTATSTVSIPVSETTKVSDKISEYENAELGFKIKYPSAWEELETVTGISLLMPIDKAQVSTIAKLQADVNAAAGKCSFPPVTTVKERSSVKLGENTFNMISMSNTVQGRNYFNRMYSLEKNSICYFFSFASITQSTTSKGLTGSNATQAENNNRAIIDAADKAFTNMVQSFAFVVGPQGVDESKAAPVRQ